MILGQNKCGSFGEPGVKWRETTGLFLCSRADLHSQTPTLVFAGWVTCDEKCVEWGFTSPSVSIFVSSHTWKWEKAIFGLSVCVLSKHVLKSLCSELPWMLQLSSALQSVLWEWPNCCCTAALPKPCCFSVKSLSFALPLHTCLQQRIQKHHQVIF